MNQEVMDKLGKMYFTLNSMDKNNKGIGIGLYISSKIIKKLNFN